MATESGTSARAKKEMTFEAVPPGQQETRIRPIAKGVGKLNSQPRQNPRSGISEYWRTIPGRTVERSRAIRRRSSRLTVIPMQSMMMPKPRGISGPLNQVKNSGLTMARPLASRSQRGKALVTTVSNGNVGMHNIVRCLCVRLQHLINARN